MNPISIGGEIKITIDLSDRFCQILAAFVNGIHAAPAQQNIPATPQSQQQMIPPAAPTTAQPQPPIAPPTPPQTYAATLQPPAAPPVMPQPPMPSQSPAAPQTFVAPPSSPSMPQQPPAMPPAPSTVPTAAPAYQLDDLSRAAAAFADAAPANMERMRGLLAQHGVQSLVELPPDRYGAFANDMRGMGVKL